MRDGTGLPLLCRVRWSVADPTNADILVAIRQSNAALQMTIWTVAAIVIMATFWMVALIGCMVAAGGGQ